MSATQRTSSLAIYGGPKLRKAPWPKRGLIGSEERAAVDAFFDRVMASGGDILYGGPEEEAYCREFAESLGGGYADAVNSGTSAVYVALRTLNLEPFTEVIVSAVTDPGGMMPIPLLNMIPVVADTGPDSYNTTPEQVESLITPLTSAILVSHIGGEPVDMEGIITVAMKHGLPVIEDCAQAHGAKLKGRPLGTFGDIASFSTMFGKHHSTGGQGGLVYSKDEATHEAGRRLADRGKPFGLPEGSTNVVASLNLNSEELSAVIGREQLRKLPNIVERRRQVVSELEGRMKQLKLVSFPAHVDGAEPSYWFLRLKAHAEKATCDKETYCRALAAEGLPIALHYRFGMPHQMQWFRDRSVFGASRYPWSSADYEGDPERRFPCPNANATMDTHFNLQIHESWGEREIVDAAAIFEKIERAFAEER